LWAAKAFAPDPWGRRNREEEFVEQLTKEATKEGITVHGNSKIGSLS